MRNHTMTKLKAAAQPQRSIFLLILVVFLLCPLWILAQDDDGDDPVQFGWVNNFLHQQVQIPPSPTASALGTYGDHEVDYYSGTVKMAIPIHTFQGRHIQHGVSLGYITQAQKVDQAVASVGLGFSLAGGGVISRTVRGYGDDDFKYYSKPPFDSILDLAPSSTISINNYTIYEDIEMGHRDPHPDLFHLVVGNINIQFIITPGGEIITRNKTNIKIEPIIQFFNQITAFRVTDTRGNVYIFDKKEKSYFEYEDTGSQSNGPPIPQEVTTGWYLTSITSFDGVEKLNFNYTTDLPDKNNGFSMPYNTLKYQTYSGCPITPLPSGCNPMSMKQSLINPVTLFRRQTLRSIASSFNGEVIESIIFYHSEQQWPDALDYELQLDSILIQGKQTGTFQINRLKKYNLNFSYETNRLTLKKLTEYSEDGTVKGKEWNFEYNIPTLPDYTSPKVDHWGYSNGYNNTSLIPTVSGVGLGANRSPRAYYAQAGVIRKIIYPTGGSTRFYYESHKNTAGTVIGGGIRIEKIVTNPIIGPKMTRTFSYTGGELITEPKYREPMNYYNTSTNVNGGYSMFTCNNVVITANSIDVLQQVNGSYVCYENVLEHRSDKSYSEYSFSTVGTFVNSFFGANFQGLKKMAHYDSNHVVVQSVENFFRDSLKTRFNIWYPKPYTYQDNRTVLCRFLHSNGNIYTTFQYPFSHPNNEDCIASYSPVYSKYNPGLRKVQTYFSFIDSTRVFKDGVAYSTATDINWQYLLRKRQKLYDYGKIYTKTYRYSFDENDSVHLNLLAQNRLSVIEQKNYVDSTLITGNRMNYSFFDSSGVPTTAVEKGPFLHELDNYEMTWKSQGTIDATGWVRRGVVLERDSSSNLITKVKSDDWEVERFTYNTLGQLKEKQYENFIQQYDYDPSNAKALIAMHDIDGQITRFAYDDLWRLKNISTRDSNVHQTYTYAYMDSSGNQNHVHSTSYFTPVTNGLTSLENITFLDGLGRDIQEIKKGYSPSMEDIVLVQAYDTLGRPVQSYEPFEITGNNGSFVSNIPASVAFSNTTYEANSFNRPKTHTPPSWYADTTTYGSNQTNEVYDHKSQIYYPPGSLYKQTHLDSEGKEFNTFTDVRGRVLLQRQLILGVGTDTYILYDEKNRPTHVIPPDNAGVALNDPNVYAMAYDGRDRLIMKKIPGKDTIRYRYNNNDLLTYMKDGIQPWLHFEYDEYGRETYVYEQAPDATIGKLLSTKTYYNTNDIRNGKLKKEVNYLADSSGAGIFRNYFYDTYGRLKSINGNHAENLAAEASWQEEMDYDFADNLLRHHRTIYLSDTTSTTYCDSFVYDHSGRLSAHFHRVNNETVQLSHVNYTVKDEVLQKQLGVTAGNALQEIDYAYLDNGLLKRINTPALRSIAFSPDSVACITPDDQCNQSSTLMPVNNDLFYLELSYDQLLHPDLDSRARKDGLISQMTWRVPGLRKQSYGFHYDDHNRLRDANYAEICPSNNTTSNVNRGLYDVHITYHDKRGNIGTMERSGWAKENACPLIGAIDNLSFSYDGNSDRILQIADAGDAGYRQHGFAAKATGNYTYDENGNLLFDPARDMTLNYNRNNLPDTIQQGSGEKIILTYCENGSKKRQRRYSKGGTLIEDRYYVGDVEIVNGKIEAIHHSDGRVVNSNHASAYYVTDTIQGKVLHITAKRIISDAVIDSLAQVTFTACDSILHLPGFTVRYTGSNEYCGVIGGCDTLPPWTYEYNLTDHLGNVRVIFSDRNMDGSITVSEQWDNEVLSIRSYYPGGGLHHHALLNRFSRPDLALKSRYSFNGKESYGESDLMDFSARSYDRWLLRFHQIDPLADDSKLVNQSTYSFGFNNPVSYIDPTGMEPRFGGAPAVPSTNPESMSTLTGDGVSSMGSGEVKETGPENANALGDPPPGGRYILEGFRRYFQAAGRTLDNFAIKIFGKSSTTVSSRKLSFAGTEVEVRGSVEVEASATMGTNFEAFFDNSGGNESPTAPAFRLETSLTTTFKDTKSVKTKVKGFDVNAKVQMTTDGSKSKQTNEVMFGKLNSGVYISQSGDFSKEQLSNKQISVGVKAVVKSPEIKKTTISIGAKAYYEINN